MDQLFRRARYGLGRIGGRIPLVWLRHRGLGSSDGFVASYPRSGSTWLRFQLHHALTGKESDFEAVNNRIPDVGGHGQAPLLLPQEGRLVKTHELPRPSYHRSIYLVRDPRDVCLSEFSYMRMRGLTDESLESFVKRFLDSGVNSFGSWCTHVSAWLRHAESSQVLLIRYEDLRADGVNELEKVMAFLGTESKVALEEVSAAASVASMRRSEELSRQAGDGAVSAVRSDIRFIRSGKVGGWQEGIEPLLRDRFIDRLDALLTRLGYVEP